MGKTHCINCMKMIDEETAFCPHCGFGQKGEASPFGLKPGTILRGRYLVGRVLGQGGFGLTYVGYDLTLEIKTAIKEYFPLGLATRNSTVSNQVQRNTTQLDRESWQAGCDSFLKEARRMAKIDSLPGIVRVRDTFPENQTAYIVMDFIEGETLKQKLSKTGPMKYSECVRLLRPLMESLGRVHKQGLIHRDISPDNIMVQPDGSVCLLDFGAAKDISFQQTVASQQVAKKGFSPPEQYREKGSIGSWTDVYALCATIYYCITGKLVPEATDRLYEDTLDFDVFLSEPLSENAAGALKDGLKLRAEERIRTVEELLGRFDGTGNTGKETGAGTGDTGTGGKRTGGAEPDNAGTGGTRTDGPESGVGADMGRQADFQKSPHPQQDDRAASREGDEEPQDRGAVGQEDSTAPQEDRTTTGENEEERPDGNASRPGSGEKPQGDDAAKPQETQDSGTAGEEAEEQNPETSADAAKTREESVHTDSQEKPEKEAGPGAQKKKISKKAIGAAAVAAVLVLAVIGLASGSGGKDADTASQAVSGQTETELSTDIGDDEEVLSDEEETELPADDGQTRDEEAEDIGDNGEIATDEAEEVYGTFNMLMADDTCEVSKEKYGDYSPRGTVLGSEIRRENIVSIQFVDTLDEAADDAWDVSLGKDGTVMAWTRPNAADGQMLDLWIGAEGKITPLDCTGLFEAYYNVEVIDFNGCFDTSPIISMRDMFYSCESLIQLDVSGFETGRVTDMQGMFHACSSLPQLDVSGFDTSQVTDMSGMFSMCSNLKWLDVNSFDTGKVMDMRSMFASCENLTQLDVSIFDTSQVMNMAAMFYNCKGLMQLNMYGFDTSQVTEMWSMFKECESLTQLDVGGFDTSQVTEMWSMFEECESLTQLDVGGFNTSRVMNMSEMFRNCKSLTQLDVSGFDMSQIENMEDMFAGCGVTAEQAGLKTE